MYGVILVRVENSLETDVCHSNSSCINDMLEIGWRRGRRSNDCKTYRSVSPRRQDVSDVGHGAQEEKIPKFVPVYQVSLVFIHPEAEKA